jgi:hypothetical protein
MKLLLLLAKGVVTDEYFVASSDGFHLADEDEVAEAVEVNDG